MWWHLNSRSTAQTSGTSPLKGGLIGLCMDSSWTAFWPVVLLAIVWWWGIESNSNNSSFVRIQGEGNPNEASGFYESPPIKWSNNKLWIRWDVQSRGSGVSTYLEYLGHWRIPKPNSSIKIIIGQVDAITEVWNHSNSNKTILEFLSHASAATIPSVNSRPCQLMR